MRHRPSPSPAVFRRGGFTLMEVMVAVVIMALLASLMIPRLTGGADRQFQLTVDRVADLLTMYAQREQLHQEPVGIRYVREQHRLELVLARERDGQLDWTVDPYVPAVKLPEPVAEPEVYADEEWVDVSEWPLIAARNAPRPTIRIVLSGPSQHSAVTLPAHAIVPVQTSGRSVTNPYSAVDLDAAGRSREQW